MTQKCLLFNVCIFNVAIVGAFIWSTIFLKIARPSNVSGRGPRRCRRAVEFLTPPPPTEISRRAPVNLTPPPPTIGRRAADCATIFYLRD
jgi:hypothetical protein